MKNNQGLGINTVLPNECLAQGCDPDFFLYSSVLVPAGGVGAAFPGGGSDGDATGPSLWFFQKGLKLNLQSPNDYLQGATLVSATSPIAGLVRVNSMQVSHIGLQISSAFGNNTPLAEDIQTIAENAVFEMWLGLSGTSQDNLNISNDADIRVPMITMPSHVGLFGSVNTSSEGIATLGIPGMLNVAELREKPILQQNQLIAARVSFPPMIISTGVGPAVTSTPVAVTTPQGVIVRLFMFGKAVHS